ncbi:hypothetical protein TELCIR_19056 [Teladorsagia circumcincta]|uniref:Uncharacterized protein n=1 Tax=Teladorsagia circumcincta TaxID=45464 RepID=A0A2G9TQB1_TELCI|nr:hypothetical protein TELCIR_19056 [Teladorsagia circumcincta]
MPVAENYWSRQADFVAKIASNLKGAKVGVVDFKCPASAIIPMGYHTPDELKNALRYPVIQPGKDRCMSCAAYKIIDDMLKEENVSKKHVLRFTDKANCTDADKYSQIVDNWPNVGVYSTYIAAPIQYIDLTNGTFDPTVWNVDYVLNGLKNAQADSSKNPIKHS